MLRALWQRMKAGAAARGAQHLVRKLRDLLQHEAVSGQSWRNRAIVLGFAAATGAVAVGFTLLSEAAHKGFEWVAQSTPLGGWALLVWTPALTVLVLWITRRLAPAAQGSGIPPVLRALDEDLQPAQRSWLVSLRLSPGKLLLTCGGM